MRIRMTRAVRGDVDGILLTNFQVGLTYDVSPSLATYLIMTGSAEPIIDDTSAVMIPINKRRMAFPPASPPMDVAADATRRDTDEKP